MFLFKFFINLIIWADRYEAIVFGNKFTARQDVMQLQSRKPLLQALNVLQKKFNDIFSGFQIGR